MKKYITFVAVSSLLFCSSCTSFLEETNPNKIPASNFYQTEDDIAMAANGAYAALRGNGYLRICIYTQMFVRKTPRCRTREQEMGLIINFITIH